MPADKSKSLIMAQRLKELRTEKGFSHEALRKALMDKYEIDISVDSLKNYEVSKVPHAKAYKNEGMRVEYLRCLADFYGVPTDYVLGITDIRSPDIATQEIIKRTGLSEKNVVMLCAAQSAIDAAESMTEIECDCKSQEQFLSTFDFLADVCPRYVGFNFTLLINDLISASLTDQGMLIDYGTLLDASRSASIFPDCHDHQMLMNQFASGMIPLPACEYVRYISNEIGKYLSEYLGEKYGYRSNSKDANNDDLL